MNTADRRAEIINILLVRRRITAKELADEFNVTVRTIQNDIQALSLGFPIYTKQGGDGGIFVGENYKEYALSVGIECEQTVVDDGASTSVDRPQMRQLMEILEISDYKVLVVEDIYEITRNPEDLKSMMDRINDLGVTIFDLGTMSARYNNYAIEC